MPVCLGTKSFQPKHYVNASMFTGYLTASLQNSGVLAGHDL